MVPKRYTETIELAAVREISDMLKNSDLFNEGKTLLAVSCDTQDPQHNRKLNGTHERD